MVEIELETVNEASLETCFNLARSLSAHIESTSHTGERIIERPDHDLLELGDVITFEARHFGIRQKLTSKMVAFDAPNYFRDEMQKGAFRSFSHDHSFLSLGPYRTAMSDVVKFSAPFGPLGQLIEVLVLRTYMRGFIVNRAESLKQMAEAPGQ